MQQNHSFMVGEIPQEDVPRYVDIYLKGRLPVGKLCSEHIRFDQRNEAFDKLNRSTMVRQILLRHGA